MRRFSIAKAMVLVAVLAVNIGVARMLYVYDEEIAAAAVPIGLLIQLGILQAIHGRARAFWIGFAVAATACLATFVIASPDSDSIFSAWWSGYFAWVIRSIRPLGRLMQDSAQTGNGVLFMLIVSAIETIPHLVIGLVGALISWGIARPARRPSTSSSTEPHHSGPLVA